MNYIFLTGFISISDFCHSPLTGIGPPSLFGIVDQKYRHCMIRRPIFDFCSILLFTFSHLPFKYLQLELTACGCKHNQ
jgi:hypothetical protein